MDPSVLDATASESIQKNDHCDVESLTQSYLQLKKKICKTHEVIKQYNDKLKECERLKTDLDAATKQTKKVTCNYNSSLAKVIKLELQNTEYKKNIETLTTEINDHKVKAAADQQHIQQLVCKIKDIESHHNDLIMQHDLKKSSLEVKVKELDQELKNVKKTYDMKIKKMEKKTTMEHNSIHKSNNSSSNDSTINICNKVKMVDVGTVTVLSKEEIKQKPQVSNKCIITDEFYGIKDDMYPIFCAKCEVRIEPTPLDKICKIMTESCPKLLEQISSSPKKTLPPITLPSSSNTVTERCESESLIALPETPPPRMLNQINHSQFMSPNHLPPQASVEPTRSNYNNCPPAPSFINPIYIGSTPVTSVSVAKSTTSQSTHCDEISMVAPSLSIISSLQKRVDTLEKKLKKKLNKKKLEQSSNCWQYPNPYYMYDINNSIQANFMQLWQKMTDLYENKEKEQHIVNKRRDRSLNKCKLSRLKSIKRLQNAHAGNTWKIETLTKRGEPNSVRKRPKKRKYRHSMLLNKPDVPIEISEDLEESDSNSDSNSCNDSFTEAADIAVDASTNSKNESRVETTSSVCNNDLQMLACPQSTDADEPETVDVAKNSVECNKSVNGETDSGILSDSVESSKLVQLEADLDVCSPSKESQNLKDQSSKSSVPCSTENSNSVISDLTEKSSTEVNTPDTVTEKVTESEISRSSEEIDTVEINDFVPEITIPTSENVEPTRKRKISELEETKKCDRQQLLRKMKNLGNYSIIPNKHPNVSKHHEVEYGENKDFCALQGEDHLEKEDEDAKEGDYIPKKKPRIAHVPKATVTQKNISLNNCAQVRVCSGENLTKKKESLEIMAVNHTNINRSPIVKLTKLTLRNRIDLYESPVTPTVVKQEDNQELKNKCSSSIIEPELESLSIASPDAALIVETNDDNKVSTNDTKCAPEYDSQVKDLFGDDSDTSEKFDSPRSPDDSFGEPTKVNETDDQLKKEYDFDSPESPDDSFGESVVVNETKFILTEAYEQLKKENETNFPGLKTPIVNMYNTVNEFNNQTKCKENDKCNDSLIENAIVTDNVKSQHCQDSDNKSRNPSIIKHKLSVPQKKVQGVVENDQSCNSNNSSLNVNNVQENKMAEISPKEITCITQRKLNSHPPIKILREFAKNSIVIRNSKKELQQLEKIRSIADNSVIKQLQRLMHSDWQDALNLDVIEKLKSTYTPRIIAKNIVDYLCVEQKINKNLSSTYTPPAPLMTKVQQRIVSLLTDLEESIPMIIQLVQSGIEYKLFKLNQQIQKSAVESLARMYVILARMKKDRQRVRIFCCDALYCLGLSGILVLYTVFTCWPESFPNNETSYDLLPKCVAHLILTQQATDYPKLSALKNLLSVYYKYPPGTLSMTILKDLLTALQEKCHPEIETSIKLLAKKEGLKWTYENIIKGALLPMIINGNLPNMYRAFGLLGDLMRVFPIDDKDNSVGAIVEQLCDLISSGEGSDEQQEGVISALLSLSRHKFDTVLSTVTKWTPTAPLHDRTVAQISGMVNQRDPHYWRGYLKKCGYLKTGKRSKT